MHLSSTLAHTILAFGSNALAIPTSSTNVLARRFNPLPDDPSMTPVDVRDLGPDATMTCGSSTFNRKDIYLAVQWGTILEAENLGRGRKDPMHPNGRFPHDYTETTFSFNNHCPADPNRLEYPLVKNGPYNGAIGSNTSWGKHRVIFYGKGEEAPDGNPIVYFCGGVTHEGAPAKNKFVQCTVH